MGTTLTATRPTSLPPVTVHSRVCSTCPDPRTTPGHSGGTAWRQVSGLQGALPLGHPLSWGWMGLQLWEEGHGGRWGGGALPWSLLRLSLREAPVLLTPAGWPLGLWKSLHLADFSLCDFIPVSAIPSRGCFSPSLPAPPTAAAAMPLTAPSAPGLSPSSAAPTSALSPVVVTGLRRKLSLCLPAHQASGQEQAFPWDSGSGLTPEITLLHLPMRSRLPGSQPLLGRALRLTSLQPLPEPHLPRLRPPLQLGLSPVPHGGEAGRARS